MVDLAAEEAVLFRDAGPHAVVTPQEVRYELSEKQITTLLQDGHYTQKVEVRGPTFRIVAGRFEAQPIAMDPDAGPVGQEARAYITLTADVREGNATIRITEVEQVIPPRPTTRKAHDE